MTWDEWLIINRENIKHVAGFEEQFVTTVLRKIPEITPDDVISQYHFSDFKRGNRYIDFMILNKAKGYALPIELDGLWKVQDYDDFNDMLERQNALITKYGILLRFTNKQMCNEPNMVIKNIKNVLSLQQQKLSTESLATATMQETIIDYKKKLDELNEALRVEKMNNQTSNSKELESIKKTLQDLQNKVNHQSLSNNASKPVVLFPPPIAPNPPTIPPITPANKKNDSQLAVAGIVAAILVGGGIYAVTQNKNKDSANEPVTTYSDNSTEIKPLAENAYPSAIESTKDTPRETSMVTAEATEEKSTPNRENTDTAKEAISVEEPTNKARLAPKEEPVSTGESNISQIDAKQAAQHIGEQTIVCGDVAQVKEFSKGYYLNLGNTFPHQDATVLVWSSNVDKFDDLSSFEGNSICVKGMINTYKGVPQIEMRSPSQIYN
jgi:very-short-patch-repair endonuclease